MRNDRERVGPQPVESRVSTDTLEKIDEQLTLILAASGEHVNDILDRLDQDRARALDAWVVTDMRLTKLEAAVVGLSQGAGSEADQGVVLVTDRLNAIAAQIDRLTPLARAGDQASTVFEKLSQLGPKLDRAITLMQSPPKAPAPARPPEPVRTPEPTRPTEPDPALARNTVRLDAVLAQLADLAQRQGQLTTAVNGLLQARAADSRRLQELRAERESLQARLWEERLLAAKTRSENA